MLNRASGVTIWRQIAETLAAEIQAGTFAPGSRLPVEAELAARFGVNRHTLRRAIETLAQRGLVRSVQGSGTYVEAGRLTYPVGERTRFTDIVVGQAHEAGGDLIEAGLVPVQPDIAADLALLSGTPVMRLVIRRRIDGVPVMWAEAFFPAERCAAMGEHYARTGSLTAALRACGVADYRRAWTRIGATLTSAIDAGRLDLAPGRPILTVDSLNVDLNGTPVQRGRSHMVADRLTLLIATPDSTG